MRINAKDIAAGGLLVAVAAAGYYLNLDHNLGTARRMGPGYMPWLVFLIQLGIGAIVVVLGFFNGPDPMERWTGVDIVSILLAVGVGLAVWRFSPLLSPFFASTYNAVGVGLLAGFLVLSYAVGWRLIGFICASMCAFGLLLEKGGLLVTLVATILISVLAEPDHLRKPIGVLGLTVFLLGLCWWIFIRQLDIRVAVWPQF